MAYAFAGTLPAPAWCSTNVDNWAAGLDHRPIRFKFRFRCRVRSRLLVTNKDTFTGGYSAPTHTRFT